MKKRTIVIIGGAGHLGQVFVRSLTTTCIVYVFDIIQKDAWSKIDPGQTNFIHSNISDSVSLQDSIQRVHADRGHIDCVINTSYPRTADYGKEALTISLEDFNQNITIHLGGYFNVMQKFIQYFMEQGVGNIINVASIQGIAAPKFSHYNDTDMTSPIEYSAAKSAIIAMTRYFAKYLKGRNIRVNCVSPGGILAGQPSSFLESYKASCLNKGMLDTEDLLGTVKFLLSQDSKFINGQNIIIDDGWSL